MIDNKEEGREGKGRKKGRSGNLLFLFFFHFSLLHPPFRGFK